MRFTSPLKYLLVTLYSNVFIWKGLSSSSVLLYLHYYTIYYYVWKKHVKIYYNTYDITNINVEKFKHILHHVSSNPYCRMRWKLEDTTQRCLSPFSLLRCQYEFCNPNPCMCDDAKEGCVTEELHISYKEKKKKVLDQAEHFHCLKIYPLTFFFSSSQAHIACTGLDSCKSILFYLQGTAKTSKAVLEKNHLTFIQGMGTFFFLPPAMIFFLLVFGEWRSESKNGTFELSATVNDSSYGKMQTFTPEWTGTLPLFVFSVHMNGVCISFTVYRIYLRNHTIFHRIECWSETKGVPSFDKRLICTGSQWRVVSVSV